jgi:hypothetical protein
MSALAAEGGVRNTVKMNCSAGGRKVVRLSSEDGHVADKNNAADWYKTIRLVTQDIGEVAIAIDTPFSADVSSKAYPCKTELDKCVVASLIPPPF